MIKRILDLRLFRENHNIKTQKELAEKLEMPLSSINKYELNGTDPEHIDLIPLSLLIKISDKYQVKIDDILTKKQFIDTNNPLVIESDFYKPVHEKQSQLCLPLNNYGEKIENDSSLGCDLKRSIKHLISNEVKYFCSIYHKPLVGLVSKYNQDSVSLIQMLLGEDLSIKEEIYNALNNVKPIYFVHVNKDNGEYIQYYKCKNNHILFPDINIVDYSEFSFSDFEIVNKKDYDFSVCYLNNELLNQITITKFEYKNANDVDSYFAKYQNFYSCDFLILSEKIKKELENDRENIEKKKQAHDCSIYNYKNDEILRTVNDINTRKSMSISAAGGEDISKEEYNSLREQLHKEICAYYELKNGNAVYWIKNYINRINEILNQLMSDNSVKSINSEVLGQISNKIEEILSGISSILNSLNERRIFENIDLQKIDDDSKKLLRAIQKENTNENNSYDCSYLKNLFALIMEFIFGYHASVIKSNIETYLSRPLNELFELFQDPNFNLHPSLAYFSLLEDITCSIKTNKELVQSISKYSMNYSPLTIENLIHYISYQILSIYNSKAFKLADKVKFYHRTDPYVSKIKKIIKTIKESDIESETETEAVNKKIENAVMGIKNEFDTCMENFNYIQKDSSTEKSVLSEFISINEKLLKTDL